ncbi:MAG: hypothetical protein V1793_17320 [Pseudomonadota bacterium]
MRTCRFMTQWTLCCKLYGLGILILFLAITVDISQGKDVKIVPKAKTHAISKMDWSHSQQDLLNALEIFQKELPQTKGQVLRLQKELQRADLMIKKAIDLIHQESPAPQDLQNLFRVVKDYKLSVESIVNYLKAENERRIEEARERRDKLNSMIEDFFGSFDNKAQQLLNLLVTVLNTMHEMCPECSMM